MEHSPRVFVCVWVVLVYAEEVTDETQKCVRDDVGEVVGPCFRKHVFAAWVAELSVHLGWMKSRGVSEGALLEGPEALGVVGVDYPSLGAVYDLGLYDSVGDGQFCFGGGGFTGEESFA